MIFQSSTAVPSVRSMIFQSGVYRSRYTYENSISQKLERNEQKPMFYSSVYVSVNRIPTSLFPNPTKNCSYEHKNCIRIWSELAEKGVNALDMLLIRIGFFYQEKCFFKMSWFTNKKVLMI